MNDKERKFIEDARTMFGTQGWKDVVEDAKAKVELLKDNLTNPSITLDEFRVAQGRLEVYRGLANYEAYIDAVEKQLNE